MIVLHLTWQRSSLHTRTVISLKYENRGFQYMTVNICSQQEPEFLGILNENHYENPNLIIHNAPFTDMFRWLLCFEYCVFLPSYFFQKEVYLVVLRNSV